MGIELVYRSKKNNNYYWTINTSFTRKMHDHFEWESTEALQHELPELIANHPNLFTNKNKNNFLAYDNDTDKSIALSTVSNPASANGDPNSPTFNCPLDLSDGSIYVIAVDGSDGRYYFSTSKGEFFSDIMDSNIRRWKELEKAAATANNIRVNKKVWDKYPQWNPLSNYVFDLRTGEAVWPDEELRHGDITIESNPNTINGALSLLLLRQLSAQLAIHFKADHNLPLISPDDKGQMNVPELGFTAYNAEKVFQSLAYLIRALAQQGNVNTALKAYDQGILQDYLHTVEIADLNELDMAEFTKALQQSRRERRQIKNLAVILNTIAANIDVEKILRSLWQNPALKNQYYYRHEQTGKQLLKQLSELN